MAIALAIQVAACGFMGGLIWLVQIVHYPAFAYVDEKKFAEFSLFHQGAISWIVIPVMFAELGTAIYLALMPSVYTRLFLVALGLLILIWASTFLLSVPQHSVLSRAMDHGAINKLVWTNWPRTILWSLRLGILVYVLSIELGRHSA